MLLWRDNSVLLELFSGWRDENNSPDEVNHTPFGKASRVAENSGSEECFQLAYSWLQTCTQTHTSCSNNSTTQLPTRVIDIHTEPVQMVTLLETNGQRGKYVALSYCWGDLSSSTLKTTVFNLQQHKTGLPLHSLPRTLRDAVSIGRRLGFRYLWVDALCIIQDDADDWAKESSVMCDIYMNAQITISADNSNGSDQGIFNKQIYGVPCPEIPYKDGQAVYTRKALAREHMKYNYSLREPIPGSINCRGWTLQEALLSKRILRYTSKELVWECNESLFCECLNSPGTKEADEFDDRYVRDPAALARLPPDQIYQNWDNLVIRFTERSLGQEKDKLPALSGLASQFAAALQLASPATPERYLAGMWLSNLAQSLRWMVEDDQYRDVRDEGVAYRRPQAWRAPSWSWASVDGPINLPPYRNFSGRLEILEAETVRSTIDTFGQVASGKLVVRGRLLLNLPFRTFPYVPGQVIAGHTLRMRYTVQCKQRLRTFTPDSVSDFGTPGESAASTSLAALLIGTIYTRRADIEHEEVFIVLRPKTPRPQAFLHDEHEVFERVRVSIREYREHTKLVFDQEEEQHAVDENVFGTHGTRGFFDGAPEVVITLI